MGFKIVLNTRNEQVIGKTLIEINDQTIQGRNHRKAELASPVG